MAATVLQRIARHQVGHHGPNYKGYRSQLFTRLGMDYEILHDGMCGLEMAIQVQLSAFVTRFDQVCAGISDGVCFREAF